MPVRTSLATLMVAAVLIGPARAHDGHTHDNHAPLVNDQHAAHGGSGTTAAGPHGGMLQAVGPIRVETVIDQGGLRLFVRDAQEQPVELRDARGIASLKVDGAAKRYRYDLFAETGRDNSADSLATAVDLSRIAGRQVEVEFQVVGLPQGNGRSVEFRTVTTVPMSKEQQAAAVIAKQKLCPVSKQPLGSMGKPIAVEIGGETVYVCCEGCIDAVKADPAKYVGERQPLKVTPATDADEQAIALQKVCPVMDEPLGSMGKPLKVTGLGRDVYLCCKGCLKFLEKEPEKYLAKLPPLPSQKKPEVVKATKADAKFVAAQKTCPVMDEPLDAMGGPWRTVVEGKVVYLCCPGCAKKLHADPKAYFEKLTARGVTPPAVK